MYGKIQREGCPDKNNVIAFGIRQTDRNEMHNKQRLAKEKCIYDSIKQAIHMDEKSFWQKVMFG